ncbi:hypothetical protein D3C87_1757390 [compost metagenome]
MVVIATSFFSPCLEAPRVAKTSAAETCGGAEAFGAAEGEGPAEALAEADGDASKTSPLVKRPSLPVPAIEEGSSPFSVTIR